MTPKEGKPQPAGPVAEQGLEILDEIEVEDLAVDGICGVY